jgi:chemotaxis protein methyltransferase CheR
MEMDKSTFDELRSLVYAKSGITLQDGKEALVSARVGKRMRKLGLDAFGAYLERVKGAGGEEEMVQLLDAISTNVTSFFREPQHFDFVRETVEAWHRKGQTRFRFWSAASSTGEEPYTLAMTLRDCLPPSGSGPQSTPEGDVRILATDISTRVLEVARNGTYPEAKVAELPQGAAARHFTRSREGGTCTAHEGLRSMILFKRLNLAFPPFPMQGPMDIILCRNVMIYFDNRVRSRLVAEFHRLLKPGGYLLVGHAESLTGISNGFKTVRPSIYLKAA